MSIKMEERLASNSPGVTLIHLSVPFCLCLSVFHLRFHSLITVSGPKGVFPLGWQQKGDRESRRTGEQWGGLADAVCYFSSVSHWLCQQWLLLSRVLRAQKGLDNMPSAAIGRELGRREQGGSRGCSSAICCFLPSHIPFSSLIPSSTRFHPFLLD